MHDNKCPYTAEEVETKVQEHYNTLKHYQTKDSSLTDDRIEWSCMTVRKILLGVIPNYIQGSDYWDYLKWLENKKKS